MKKKFKTISTVSKVSGAVRKQFKCSICGKPMKNRKDINYTNLGKICDNCHTYKFDKGGQPKRK